MNRLGKLLNLGIAASLLMFGYSTSATAAEDGFGISVITGTTLNWSMVALNEDLQKKYEADDVLASLTMPGGNDFATIAASSGAVPQMTEDTDTEHFGLAVTDGNSLNSSLGLLNYSLAMRGTDLFIQIANAANDSKPDFVMVAKESGSDSAIRARQQSLANQSSEFGSQINDDGSLDTHVASLRIFMSELDDREVMLAQAVPSITGASFDKYMVAIALLY